ncbi:hypothetical protein ACLOJK_021962 [Asimina triloba]
MDYYKRTSSPTEAAGGREEDLRLSSSSDTVCGKDIISTAGDLIFFFSMMTLKKVRYPTPSKEVEARHLPQPQREERSPPHNAVDARPLHATGAPPPEDRVMSNSPDSSGESLNSPVTRAKFHTLMQMIKSLQQWMVHARPDTISVPSAASASVPSSWRKAVTTTQLICVRRGPNELLRDYVTRFNQVARKVSCLLTELTRGLGLHLPRSIYELNEVIVGYISSEKTEEWWVEQDRLLVESISRVTTAISAPARPQGSSQAHRRDQSNQTQRNPADQGDPYANPTQRDPVDQVTPVLIQHNGIQPTKVTLVLIQYNEIHPTKATRPTKATLVLIQHNGIQPTKATPVLIQHNGIQSTKATPMLIQHSGIQSSKATPDPVDQGDPVLIQHNGIQPTKATLDQGDLCANPTQRDPVDQFNPYANPIQQDLAGQGDPYANSTRRNPADQGDPCAKATPGDPAIKRPLGTQSSNYLRIALKPHATFIADYAPHCTGDEETRFARDP